MKNAWMLAVALSLMSAVCFAQDQEAADPSEASGASEPPVAAAEEPAPPVPPSMPAAPPVSAAASVQSLNFNYAPGKSRLEISLSKDPVYESTVLEKDHQVILEIKDAVIPRKYARKLDTSSFKSNVSLVSPYQAGNDVRVVFQLKEGGDVDFVKEGGKLIAVIDNKEGAPQKKKDVEVAEVTEAAPASPQGSVPPPVAADNASPPVPSPQTQAPGEKESVDGFIAAHESKKYLGKPITLQLREADIHDVFRVIAEASEFNIVLGDDVKGKLTLDLVDVPWDQALDIVMNANRLAAERFGSVLRVTTVDALTKEKEAEAMAKRASEAAEPLVVKIFPISYAKPDDMKRILEDFLSKEFAGGAKRGSIQIEPRTNSLVIRDTPSTMEKIKRLLRELDTQTPQVLIEAKFVEVNESNTKDVQGKIFSTSREFTSTGLDFNGTKANYGAAFGGATNTALPAAFGITPVPGASFAFAPKLGVIPGLGEISAFLSILETEDRSKTVASPRVVTQNKEKATIRQGQTIMLATSAGVGTSGSFQTVSAELVLDVTPQVTNDGNITLKINFNQNTPASAALFSSQGAVNTKSVDTTVLVDSGSTLVIGGVYQTQASDAEAGIPILRHLPLIGALFGSKTNQVTKSELFIFITPRVLNEKEAGIKG